VAYAKELAAELFVSFDDDQVALARAAGLKAENPAAKQWAARTRDGLASSWAAMQGVTFTA
jgi:hypothetical protein